IRQASEAPHRHAHGRDRAALLPCEEGRRVDLARQPRPWRLDASQHAAFAEGAGLPFLCEGRVRVSRSGGYEVAAAIYWNMLAARSERRHQVAAESGEARKGTREIGIGRAASRRRTEPSMSASLVSATSAGSYKAALPADGQPLRQ